MYPVLSSIGASLCSVSCLRAFLLLIHLVHLHAAAESLLQHAYLSTARILCLCACHASLLSGLACVVNMCDVLVCGARPVSLVRLCHCVFPGGVFYPKYQTLVRCGRLPLPLTSLCP
jgi:hypothetical protein